MTMLNEVNGKFDEVIIKPSKAELLRYGEFENCKYPNLIAEIEASRYSLCTVSDHMGLGNCREDDPIIRSKIFGRQEIELGEGLGLFRLFNCGFDYLFAKEFSIYQERPLAYYRHYETNKRIDEGIKHRKLCEKVKEKIEKMSVFQEIIKILVTLDEDLLLRTGGFLKGLTGGDSHGSTKMRTGTGTTSI